MSEIVFNAAKPQDLSDAQLRSQIENLQTTLASLNQQVILLQEAIQEKDQEIVDFQIKLAESSRIAVDSQSWPDQARDEERADETLTIVGVLMSLLRYILPPGKSI